MSTHTRTLNIPSIPGGPDGIPVTEADANYYKSAARNIRWHFRNGESFAGSNVTETVARLCEAAANALETQK